MCTQAKKANGFSSVCELKSSNGEKVLKTMKNTLAVHWKVKILFTGSHDDCINYMKYED